MAAKFLDLTGLTHFLTNVKTWATGAFVAKEDGKGLSTNDYTTAEKQKLSGLTATKIDIVKVNGSELVPDGSKSVNIDLSDYALSENVTQEIAQAVSGIQGFEAQVVEELPGTGTKGILYLVSNSGSGQNIYDEYLWINGKYEKLGTREIDLSAYAKKTEIPTKTSQLTNDSGFLSTVPDEYVTEDELAGKNYQTETQVSALINEATNGMATQTWVTNRGYQTEDQVQSAIISAAPTAITTTEIDALFE